MPRLIDDFDVVLLDMGNTFMFDCDRFFDPAELYRTYCDLGGTRLDAVELATRIGDVLDVMYAQNRDPASYERFQLVRAHLDERHGDLAASERHRVEAVVARHECGRVPIGHAEAVRSLHHSHPLGLISNIWSPKDLFEAELRRAGVLDVFDVRVWSSDHGCIKPAQALFRRAIDHFGMSPERMVYVGDNPRADVGGANAAGMASVWIENEERPLEPGGPQPRYIVSSLHALL